MIELIPAIDIINGQCVRLTKGEYSSKKCYDVSPLDIARQVEEYGFKRLHLVDLDGAKSKRVVNISVLRDIVENTNLLVDFGGGIKSDEDIKLVFDSGATYATVGSVAVSNPDMFESWIALYGAQRLILGADVNNGFVCINGWKEQSKIALVPFIRKYYEMGVRNVLCTDISRDGMLQGTSVNLYKGIIEEFPGLHLIASGGVSSQDDIVQLDEANIPAVVFGKAIYEGRVNLKDLAHNFLEQTDKVVIKQNNDIES